MSRGVLYVAIGDGIQVHLKKSIRSLHQHCPDLKITVITDVPKTHYDDDVLNVLDRFYPVPPFLDDEGFQDIPNYPDRGYYSKVKYFYFSPYDYTLFLDHDTYILDDIGEIFDALEHGRFHFMAAHDVGRPYSSAIVDIPFCLPTFNTGVVAYRKCQTVELLMHCWWENLKALRDPWGDQPSFLQAVYDNLDLRYAVMPKAYNYRFWFPQHAYEKGGPRLTKR